MRYYFLFAILLISGQSFADCAKYDFSCKSALTAGVISIDKLITEKESLLKFREVLGDDIKCILEVKNIKKKKMIKIFSHICEFKKDNFGFVPSPIYCNDIGNSKKESIRNSDIKYFWQKGECSENSEEYFYKLRLEIVTTAKKLLKNKFLLVSEDDKSQTYYANPGYVVKLEKNDKLCKKNKNCELNIILKKRLNSAILDADGKLHTDESL